MKSEHLKLTRKKKINENFRIFRFSAQYVTNIQKSPAELRLVENVELSLLKIGQQSLRQYNFQYLTAASVLSNGTIIVWFNNQPIHSAALSLSLVHDALIKSFFGEDYGIRVFNKPLNIPLVKDDPDGSSADNFGKLLVFRIVVIMPILSASYIIFYIKV